MKKRRLSNLLGFTLLMASFFVSCQVGVNDPSTPDSTKTGVIIGKVIYENENVTDYSDIQVTLFSTNGLMATNYCVSRGIATNARSVESITTTDQDGNYIFENVPEGVYTIYASSNSSKQKAAVATNVVVRAAETATLEDLGLIATGSIKGKITIDEETTDVLGLDVFIAGTSYIAKVASDGTYEISDIPAQTDYMLCVQKGEKTKIIKESLEVKANNIFDAETKDISSSEWESTAFEWLGSSESAPKNPKKHGAYFNTLDGCSYIWTGEKWDLLAGATGNTGSSITWKGSLAQAPEDPQLYWAYYNTTDGCSYIWTGENWDIISKSGLDGTNGEDGTDGIDGLSITWKGTYDIAPENPELNWAYFNNIDGCSYIYNGNSWDLLAQAGRDGANADTSDKYKGLLDLEDFLPSKFILEENLYSNGCREDFYDLPYYHQLPNLGDKITLELEFTSDTNISDLKIRFADSSLAAGGWKELTGEEDEWFTIEEITAGEKTTVEHTFELQERPIGNVRLNLISSDDSFEKAELTIHSSKITVTSSTGIPNYMNSYSIYGTTEKFIRGDVVVNKNAWDDTGVNYNYQTNISLPPNSHLLEEDDLVTITWEFISDTDIEKLCFKCVDHSSSYEEYWTYISDGFFVSDKIIANEPYTVNASIPITKKATGQITIEISYPKENNGEATLSTINSTLKISRRDVSNNDESSQSKFTYTPTKDGIKFGGSLLSNIQDQTAKCTISIRDVDNGVTMNREYSLANSNAYESWEMVYPLVEKDKEYTFEVSTKCGATTISSEKVIVTAIGGLGEYKIENADTYTVTLSDDKKTLTRTPQEFTDNLNVQNLVIDYGTKYAVYSTNDSATTIWDGIWRHDSIHWASTTNQECDLTNLETWLSYEGLVSSLKGRRLGTRTETHMTLAGYTYNGTTDFVLNDYKEKFFDWDDEEQYKYFVLYKDPKTGEYYEDVPGTSLYYIKEELENGNIIFTEKDAEGSIEVHGQLISYGDKLYEPAYVPATEIEDHVFTGYWKANCGYKSIEQINFPYNSNDFGVSGEVVPVYLTPIYKPFRFNIHFVDENRDVVLPSIKTTQQTIRIETMPPTRDNYRCNYWKDSLSEDATTIYPWTDLKLTEYDTYLYAKYELERVKLNFLNEDGSIFETKEIYDYYSSVNGYYFSVNKEDNRISMTQDYTYTPSQKPVSSKDNKVFDHWECETGENFDAYQNISSIGKISDVINFYPVFRDAKVKTVYFNDENGNQILDPIVLTETNDDNWNEFWLPEIPEKSGYISDGYWYEGENAYAQNTCYTFDTAESVKLFTPNYNEPEQFNYSSTYNLKYLYNTMGFAINCSTENSYTVYWADSYSETTILETLLNESSLSLSESVDIKVSVYSADGKHIITDTPNDNGPITFVPNINGTYVIKVEPYNSSNYTGWFAIKVEETTSSDDPTNP